LQLLTAVGGVFGAIVALISSDSGNDLSSVGWILPFTAGGFLNIALAQILPDLLRESNPR
jgi:zinc transporter ZupT